MLNINTENAIHKASKLLKKGELEEAAKIYNNLLEKFPNNLRAQKGLAQLCEKKNTNLKPQPSQKQVHQLSDLYNNQKFFEALEYGKELINDFLCGPDIYWIMGLSSYSVEDFMNSKLYLEKAIQIDPVHLQSLFQLGVIFQNNLIPQTALAYYKRVLVIDKNHFNARFNLAICLSLCNQKDEAIVEFEKCKKINPNYFHIYTNLGVIYLDLENINEAQINFKKALELNQSSAIALNNYGVSLFRDNNFNKAIDCFKKAIIIDPQYAEAYLNYGMALKDIGDIDQSIEMFKKSIQINPDLIEGYNNLAGILNIKCEYRKAIKVSKKSIELDEKRVETYNNILVSHENLGEYVEVVDICKKVIQIDPGNISILIEWGKSLFKLGKKNESINKFSEILQTDPTNILASINIVEVFNSQKKYKKALDFLDNLLVCYPENPDVLASMGNTKSYLNDYESAVYFYEKSLKINNAKHMVMNCLGLCYTQMGSFDKAEEVLNNSLNIVKNDQAYNNLGYLFSKKNNLKKAEFFFNQAIHLNSNYPDAQLNLGLLLLLNNNYAEGLEKYEWRLKVTSSPIFTYEFDTSYKRWSKDIELDGKVLLIHAEQGLGDTIQFSRFLDVFLDKNAVIVFKVQNCLVELFSDMYENIRVIGNNDKFEDFDFQIPLISILFEMNFDPKNYVYKTNYLKYNNIEKNEKWGSRLKKEEFLIGVSWQASKNSIGKSFEVEHLGEIAKIEGVRLISLQKNFGVEQLNKNLDFAIENLGDDFDDDDQAFLDTTAVLKQLDLVITCDTALVHLSGALEIKTFCPLKKYPDWRWGLSGENTFWYNSVKLFRQEIDGNWENVFSRIKQETIKLL